MYFQEFYYWCRDAVRKIKYIPDRNKVYLELRNHMQERYDALLERGVSPKDAVKQTVAAMGDANEVAEQLAAIHKPFWAYTLVFTRFVAIVMLFLTLGWGVYYFVHELEYLRDKELDGFNMGVGECYYTAKANVSDSSDGYTFRVTDVAIWRNDLPEEVNGKAYYDQLILRLEVHNPLPWAPEQRVLEHMWAIDSSGTYHDHALYETTETGMGFYSIATQQLSLTTYRYDLRIHNTPEDIRWIELHYDRDGRDLVLRVDLTGGEGG